MDNRKNQKKSLVAFIDILGFKEMVNHYYNNRESDLLFLLKNVLESARQKFIEFSKSFEITSANFQIKQFSDSTTISWDIHSEELTLVQLKVFLMTVGIYQRELMENGIFCRGGIALDYHYETTDFIFSKGLIKAYTNESTIAAYPRIVIDQEIIAYLSGFSSNQINSSLIIIEQFFEPYLIKDWDDIYFLDPFLTFEFKSLIERNNSENIKNNLTPEIEKQNITYQKILDNVNKNIEQNKTEHIVRRKYIWLKEFLMWHNGLDSKIIFERFKLH